MLHRDTTHELDGQGLLEYALIVILVSITAVVALGLVGVAVFEFLDTVPDMFTP